MRRLRLVAITAGLGVVLVLALGALPTSAAKAPQCLVTNTSFPSFSYTSLQAALDDAGIFWGETFVVKGTCTGVTVISTPGVTSTDPLTITGQQAKGFTAPTLDGAGQGTVLTLLDEDNTVVINSLTITGGDGANSDHSAGGILNQGTLTVNNSTITGNTTDSYGGGIENLYGSLTLNRSTVSGNSSGSIGGGLFTAAGTVTLVDSSINYNTGAVLGGGLAATAQPGAPVTVVLDGRSKVNANSALLGGGVALVAYPGGSDWEGVPAYLTLNDNSRITNNTATHATMGYGGGVYMYGGDQAVLTLNDSGYITGNIATVAGGGIAVAVGGGTIDGNTDSVYRNMPDNIFYDAPVPV